MAYGEPFSLAVAGTLALIGGIVATEVDANEAEKKAKEQKKAKKKAEREQKYQESLAAARTAEAQALDTEISLRENLHRQKVAQSDAKTGYVDAYRERLGLQAMPTTRFWQTYMRKKSLHWNVKRLRLRTNKELTNKRQSWTDSTYSLGLASAGALVYLKRKTIITPTLLGE